MTKTTDAMTDIVRNPKYACRKVDERPGKAHKHRYERRKIKEVLRVGEWTQQSMA